MCQFNDMPFAARWMEAEQGQVGWRNVLEAVKLVELRLVATEGNRLSSELQQGFNWAEAGRRLQDWNFCNLGWQNSWFRVIMFRSVLSLPERGETNENRNPSGLSYYDGDVCLRRDFRNRLDEREPACRNLFQVSSVLYRKAEVY
jgi:hypothetical protein